MKHLEQTRRILEESFSPVFLTLFCSFALYTLFRCSMCFPFYVLSQVLTREDRVKSCPYEYLNVSETARLANELTGWALRSKIASSARSRSKDNTGTSSSSDTGSSSSGNSSSSRSKRKTVAGSSTRSHGSKRMFYRTSDSSKVCVTNKIYMYINQTAVRKSKFANFNLLILIRMKLYCW